MRLATAISTVITVPPYPASVLPYPPFLMVGDAVDVEGEDVSEEEKEEGGWNLF